MPSNRLPFSSFFVRFQCSVNGFEFSSFDVGVAPAERGLCAVLIARAEVALRHSCRIRPCRSLWPTAGLSWPGGRPERWMHARCGGAARGERGGRPLLPGGRGAGRVPVPGPESLVAAGDTGRPSLRGGFGFRAWLCRPSGSGPESLVFWPRREPLPVGAAAPALVLGWGSEGFSFSVGWSAHAVERSGPGAVSLDPGGRRGVVWLKSDGGRCRKRCCVLAELSDVCLYSESDGGQMPPRQGLSVLPLGSGFLLSGLCACGAGVAGAR